jgi:hypothetical protein
MPTVNIYLTENEYVTLVNIALDKNVKVTELVQQAVKKYLDKTEVKI